MPGLYGRVQFVVVFFTDYTQVVTPSRYMRPKRNSRLIASAAIIVLVSGLSYSQWRQYDIANAEATRTRDVIQTVDRLLLVLVDAETGQRGFLLTGEERY